MIAKFSLLVDRFGGLIERSLEIRLRMATILAMIHHLFTLLFFISPFYFQGLFGWETRSAENAFHYAYLTEWSQQWSLYGLFYPLIGLLGLRAKADGRYVRILTAVYLAVVAVGLGWTLHVLGSVSSAGPILIPAFTLMFTMYFGTSWSLYVFSSMFLVYLFTLLAESFRWIDYAPMLTTIDARTLSSPGWGLMSSIWIAGVTLVSIFISMSGWVQRSKGSREDFEKASSYYEEVSGRLSVFFPLALAQKLYMEDESVFSGSRREKITILFSDLVGFDQIIDRLPPESVTEILNRYLSEMIEIVEEHEGVLDKIIGHKIMVYFGAPDEMAPKTQAENAVRMAVAMQRRFESILEEWRTLGVEEAIGLRLGINQDYVTIGNFGSDLFASYTVIGSGVNLASRIHSECAPGFVSVSYPVYIHTKESYPYGEIVQRNFKGFVRPFRICDIDCNESA